jgi:hypothetical protein
MKKRKVVADVDFFSNLEKAKEVTEIVNTIQNTVVIDACDIDEKCKPYENFLNFVKDKLVVVAVPEHDAFLFLRNRKILFDLVVYAATHLELWSLTKSLLEAHSFIQDVDVICDMIIPHLCRSLIRPYFMEKLLKLIETMYLVKVKYLDMDVVKVLLTHYGVEKLLLLCLKLEKSEFVALILPKVDQEKWSQKRSPFQLCKTVEMFNLLCTHLNPSMKNNAGIAAHLFNSNTEMVLAFLQTGLCQNISMRYVLESRFDRETWNTIVNYIDIDETIIRSYSNRVNWFPLLQILVERNEISELETLRCIAFGVCKVGKLDFVRLPNNFQIDGPYPDYIDEEDLEKILNSFTLLRTVLKLLPNGSLMEVVFLSIKSLSIIIFDETLKYLTAAHGRFRRNHVSFEANFLVRVAGNLGREMFCFKLYEKYAGVRLVPYKGYQAARYIYGIIEKQSFTLYGCILFGGAVTKNKQGIILNKIILTQKNANRYEYTIQLPLIMFTEIKKFLLPPRIDLSDGSLDLVAGMAFGEYQMLVSNLMQI